MELKIKLSKGASLPEKATDGSAAFDIRLPKDVIVKTGRNVIPTGLCMEIEDGYEVKIEPRSGFSSKGFEGFLCIQDINGNITISGTEQRFNADLLVGKIDSDYRGEVGVIVKNVDMPFLLKKGTRIAQLTVYKLPDVVVKVVDELSDTERGEGGFGHTGSM